MRNLHRCVSPSWLLVLLALIAFSPPAHAKSKKKDRGEASMKIDGALWTAQRASARFKETRLKISASWMKLGGGKAQRQQLNLNIKDYDGPGTYELNDMSSSFTAVGLNTQALEDGDDSDAAAQKALFDALSGGSVLLLKGAKVTITSANDNEVKGTFSWPGQAGRTPITDGVFRAVVKKPKGT